MTDQTEAEKLAAEKALAARDFNQKVFEYAQALGCTHEQAEVFAASQIGKFTWTGVQLIWNDTKRPAVDEPAARAYYERDKFKFLLPVKAPVTDAVAPEVAPELLAKALTGNMTARGQIVRAFGNDIAAADKFMAAERAKLAAGDDTNDNKDRNRDAGGKFIPADKNENNPWLASQWHLTEQMRVFRADPKLAHRLAAKAGVHVGAARPAKVA